MTLNRELVEKEFIQAFTKYEGQELTYLDSAATSLTAVSVVEAMNTYYLKECANVHRGIHRLSEISSYKFEQAREKVTQFINAKSSKEVIFTSGTTDSINLIARSWGESQLKANDEILITYMEHHSNIVPWQMLCERTGAKLVVCPITDLGEIDLNKYKTLLSSKTQLVAFAYVSNTLGTVNPAKEMIAMAHQVGAKVALDAAQVMAHAQVDVQELDVDFLSFSGHKMFGPTGIGVLYGKEELLTIMPPLQGGGAMIDEVTMEKTTYNKLPFKFEAGTPHIAGVIGLGAAIDLINKLGLKNIDEYEHELLQYTHSELAKIPQVTVLGMAEHKSAVVSFVVNDIHPYDLGTLLDKDGIAVRTGHHCTQPLMQRLGVSATARASFSVYNNKKDIDKLITGLKKIIDLFS